MTGQVRTGRTGRALWAFCSVALLGSASTVSAQSEVTPAASAVTASANDGNLPGNTVDNSLSSRWSANGDGQWIRYDLGTTRTVAYVRIAFYNGNTRSSRFDLQTSSDGASWTNVLTGAVSSGTTTQEQTFDFTDRSARYVRYLGHGNTVNLWNSITEVSIFATGSSSPTPTPTPTPAGSRPPGQNFNLSNWQLQTPFSSGSSIQIISQPALATYTSSAFYTAADGAMTFWCPVNGATTPNSSYPRSELRDLMEWSLNSGAHQLTASARVLQVPSNGNTIIGQVHGNLSGTELCKLRWSSGRVEAGVKPQLGGSEQRLFIGNYAIGATLNYTIRVSGHVLTVTVNGTSVSHTLNSSWDQDSRYYFKAGTYPQDNVGTSSEGSRVAFYSLSRF